MEDSESFSNILSHSGVVRQRRSVIRRSHSVTLPQLEIRVFDADNNAISKVGLSLQNLPMATFWGFPQNVEEENKQNPSDKCLHSPTSAVLSSDFFLDECPALLSQVPDSFDLGRTRVRLNSIASSARHIAIGSDCGALFLFNRRIGQSVKPLRTDHCEVISAMEFCSNEGSGGELLAVGHRSGKIVILALPSADEANPKLLQHVQDDHLHSDVQCLCWSFDGRVLFSGDASGMVLATHVDFANSQFPIGVVETGVAKTSPIVAMFSSGSLFAFAVGRKCKVCNWKRDCETVAEVDVENAIIGIHLVTNIVDHLSLLLSDGTICRKNLSENVDKLSKLSAIPDGIFQEQKMRVVSVSDGDGPSWALWAQNGHIEICCLRTEGFALETVALEGRVDQMLSVCASSAPSSSTSADELFLLAAPSVHPLQQRRRVFRLSRLSSADPSLTIGPPPPLNSQSLLFGYFYGTVEKAMGELTRLRGTTAEADGTGTGGILPQGTDELLGRLGRDLDIFLMGDGGKSGGVDQVGVKTANGFTDFLPEFGSVFPEGTTKITSGLHQMLGQIRQQSSNLFSTSTDVNPLQNEDPQKTECDHWSLAGTSTSPENYRQRRKRRDSSAKMSLPTELSCSADDEEEELGPLPGNESFANVKLEEEKAKVQVERKKIVLRRKRTKNGERIKRRDEEELTINLRNARTASEQQQQQPDPILSDWEQGRTKKEAEEEEGEAWTAGRVTDERQQQILEVLGIAPKLTSDIHSEVPTTPIKSVMVEELSTREEKSEEEGTNDGGLSDNKIVNEEIWEKKGDESRLFDLPFNSTNGYSFPSSANGGQFLEDELPPIVPSVSLADLIALFPPPPPPTSAQAALGLKHATPPHPVHPPPSSSTFSFSSSASSSTSVSSVHPSPRYQRLLRLSHVGQWRRLDVPFSVGDLTLCRHYLIACPGGKRSAKSAGEEKQRPHYLMATLLRDERALDEWVPLRVNASALAVNDDGTLLWRMCDGIAYSPCSPPDPICPSTTLSRTTAWMEMSNQFEGDIVQMALNSQNAWFLADTGRTRKERTVWVQMFLPEMGIFHRAVDEDNHHCFTQLAVSDHAVWALSGGMVVARVGLKLELAPMGLDWVDIDGQPRKFVSIALHEHTGFGLDRVGNVWFVHGVMESAPFGHGPWFKVCFPSGPSAYNHSQLSPTSEWRLRVGTPGVFIVAGSVLLHTNSPIIGFQFDHVVPDRLVLNDHFTLITATGFCGLANDCLFLCQPSSDELFSFSLRKRHFTSLPSYSSNLSSRVQCLSATRTRLFVLDKSGELHVRTVGLRFGGNGGRRSSQWMRVVRPTTEMSNSAIDWHLDHDTLVKFISVAACTNSIWTVADDNSIWVSRLDPSSPSIDDDESDGEVIGMAWTKIESPSDRVPVDQIRVSPSGNSVWLFSQTGLGWYRSDVTEHDWMGLQWSTSNAIRGIRIGELAVGDSAVWALAKDTGQLHRFGPVGWQPMEFRLKALSVDALEGRLWALDNEFRIVRHEMDVHPLNASSTDGTGSRGSESNGKTSLQQQIHQQTLSPADHSSPESNRWTGFFPISLKRMFTFFR